MNFDLSKLRGEISVVVHLVPHGVERRRENIAVLRISPIAESSGGGFTVEGFDAGSAMGSTLRTTRIGPHGNGQSLWLLIANAAYALAHAKFDETERIETEDFQLFVGPRDLAYGHKGNYR